MIAHDHHDGRQRRDDTAKHKLRDERVESLPENPTAALPPVGKLSRGAAVVMGQGFLAAIHRGAMTGVLSMLRLPAAVRVAATVPEAIEHILGRDAASWAGLAQLCAERAESED